MTCAPLPVQVGAGDLDGFQADTEEEEEEDGDCVMMDISDIAGENSPGPSYACWQQGEEHLHSYLFTGSPLYIMEVELKDSERHWAAWSNGAGGQLGPIQALEDLI